MDLAPYKPQEFVLYLMRQPASNLMQVAVKEMGTGDYLTLFIGSLFASRNFYNQCMSTLVSSSLWRRSMLDTTSISFSCAMFVWVGDFKKIYDHTRIVD